MNPKKKPAIPPKIATSNLLVFLTNQPASTAKTRATRKERIATKIYPPVLAYSDSKAFNPPNADKRTKTARKVTPAATVARM